MKLIEIDKEIKIENEINSEAEGEVSNFNQQISEFEKTIKIETDKVTPLRERNIENLSKIQRMNLELQSLDEENARTQDEIENIKKSLKTIEEDIDREKGIIIDANSNEKRLKEEKSELIEIDSKYFETEKLSNEDLEEAKNKLKNEQKAVDEIIKIFASANINISIDPITEVIRTIEKAKELINDNETNKAITLLDRSKIELNNFLNSLENDASKNKLTSVNEKNENIKLLQENYADSFSKNQSIKKESIKRNERIRAIETEIDSWKNLLSNSEKMVKELSERKNKLSIQLNDRDKQPQIQAEKKGQISEGLRIAENEKIENEKIIDETDKKIDSQRILLNEIQERSIQIRERKASSGATIEELKKRKTDLLKRVKS